MRSELFYQRQSEENPTVDLVLITQEQWQQGLTLTAIEQNVLATQQFEGKVGDIALINDNDGILVKAYVGAGENNDVLAMASAATRLPIGSYRALQTVSSFAILTWSLAQYRFDVYKKQQNNKTRVLSLSDDKFDAVIIDAAAIFLVRDLINQPSNALGPKELAVFVANMAKNHGAEFEEWVGDELLKSNFPAIHMVGRAAANTPRLLRLAWGNPGHPRVTLVGKGVCFDSGGLNIKPCQGMRIMKKDMGGAANVLGLAQWIMTYQLPIYLQVLIPAVENSIGPDAFKPGDIVVMRNGLTVEIDNTDAEGRLILADTLVKASEDNPELIIDFATLTGAARVAVGTDIAAMFTNDELLAAALTDAARATNDPIWRLPLFAGYESMLGSTVADLQNASPSLFAGAITAGLFLKHFISPSTSWVHFDIMAWNLADKPGKPEGGEAMGIRAIAYYLQKKYQLAESHVKEQQ